MARILVIDDQRINRELMHAYLDDRHTLVDAASGEEALTLAQAQTPDLVLLDVMLPGMNGFETTRRLREMWTTEYVPVLLVTSLHDQSSRTVGLRVGADDVLRAPVDRYELDARIRNLLALREERQTLARRNAELLEQQRFREELAAMLVHDLKNPLQAVLGNLEMARDDLADPDVPSMIDDTLEAAHRMLRLLANLLEVARVEQGRIVPKREPSDVETLIAPLLRQRLGVLRQQGARLETSIEPELPLLPIDRQLIGRTVENILDNAVRYVGAGLIRLTVTRAEGDPERVRIRVGNSGPPIPPQLRAGVFDKFAQAGAPTRVNVGLGLYFCRLAVEAHGGTIRVEETSELPTQFVIDLPLAAPT